MELAFKYQLYLPLMKSERRREKQEQEKPVLWNFNVTFLFPSCTQELCGKDGGQTPSILQNPGWMGVYSIKTPGRLVHPRQYWGQEKVVMGPGTRNFLA